MKRNLIFIIAITLFFPVSGRSQNNPDKGNRPNIIVILTDDQRLNTIRALGNNDIITPNLDRLAQDGVVFENEYLATAICMPSRVSLMTGQYLGTHGVGFDFPTNYTLSDAEFENSYPVLLRKAGYFTGFIGKLGFAVSPEKIRNERQTGYERLQEFMPKESFDIWNGFPGQGSYRPDAEGRFNGYENIFKEQHLTPFLGDQAIAFLRTAVKSSKPFCLSISFKAPHAPWQPADTFRRMYDTITVPRMDNDSPGSFDRLPEVVKKKSRNADLYFGRTTNYYGEKMAPYPGWWNVVKDSVYEQFIKNYYALITGMDYQIGRIRSELKRLNISENTVIIFTSDNGFFAGSRQLMGKALLYEESVRVPLIVFDPYVRKMNTGIHNIKLIKTLISQVDIYSSILELADTRPPDLRPGKSFMPVVRGKKDEIHHMVFGENNFDNFYPVPASAPDTGDYQSIRSKYVRTKKFIFIRYQECRPVIEELFDLENDKLETTNLIGNPEYVKVAGRLREELDNFEKKYVRFKNSRPE